MNFLKLEKSIKTLLSTSTNLDFVVICLVMSCLNFNFLKQHEEWCKLTFKTNFKIFYSELWNRTLGISINNLNYS